MKKLSVATLALAFSLFGIIAHPKAAKACDILLCFGGHSGGLHYTTCCHLLPDTGSGCVYGLCQTAFCYVEPCLDIQDF